MSARLSQFSANELLREIERRYLAGTVPADIGPHVGKSAGFVREKLRKLGYDIPDGNTGPAYRVDDMWTLDGNKLKEAIWRRQRAGAAKRLRALERARG